MKPSPREEQLRQMDDAELANALRHLEEWPTDGLSDEAKERVLAALAAARAEAQRRRGARRPSPKET
jgi:predicted DNA-binding transcriptional regulator YafY